MKIKIDKQLLSSYIAFTENVLNKSLASYDDRIKINSMRALSLLPEIKKLLEKEIIETRKYKEQKLFT